MARLFFFSTILSVFILSSCTTKTGSEPNSTGKGSEILVVCEKAKWDGIAGEAIREALTSEMEGLPESEPEYTLINVPYAKFSNILQTHRNVLIIEIGGSNTKASVETQLNKWSHPQRVIKINAPDVSGFVAFFREQKEGVKALFDKNERARFAAQNALVRNAQAESILEKEFGINMVISKDFYLAKKKTDFVWLRSETKEMSLGLFIYYTPYTDTSQLNLQRIVATRNKFTQENIPGPTEGSYMIVADQVIRPVIRNVNFNRSFAKETRGLWETRGDFMGGPFVNYTVVDTLRNRIVTFDGYVYYPNHHKRNFVRQLESVIWGAKFLPANSPDPEKK